MRTAYFILVTLVLSLSITRAVSAGGGPSGCSSGKSYSEDCRIVNKADLPQERLAEAIAAKGLLTSNARLSREAARLCPGKPQYWYLLSLVRRMPTFSETLNASSRAPLERALAADPGYLPALYDYALTKPTHDLKMRALEAVSSIDADNAAPFYLMAVERFQHFVCNRRIIYGSDVQAYKMTAEEWASVVDLIRKGDERPRFTVVRCALPSFQDVEVSTEGRKWPLEACVNTATVMAEVSADIGGSPIGFVFCARARGLARQASWEARQASEAGRRKEGLEMLSAVSKLGEMIAVAEPRRIRTAMAGLSVRYIADYFELVILNGRDSDVAKQSQKDWQKTMAAYEPLLNKPMKKVKGLYVARNESLSYIDYAAEEVLVTDMLRQLKLVQ